MRCPSKSVVRQASTLVVIWCFTEEKHDWGMLYVHVAPAEDGGACSHEGNADHSKDAAVAHCVVFSGNQGIGIVELHGVEGLQHPDAFSHASNHLHQEQDQA